MLDQLVRSHRASGVLLDSNVLLLLLVGRCDADRISSFKRTSVYTKADYQFLELFIALFRRVMTTPWVLAEVSNLAGQSGEPHRTELLQRLAADIKLLDERFVPSCESAELDLFPTFGLTDASFFTIAREELLVLSADWRLVGQLQNRGVAAVNFASIRPVEYL